MKKKNSSDSNKILSNSKKSNKKRATSNKKCSGFMIHDIYKYFKENKYPKITFKKVEKDGRYEYISNTTDIVNLFFPFYHFYANERLIDQRQYATERKRGFSHLYSYVIAESDTVDKTKPVPLGKKDDPIENSDIFECFFEKSGNKIQLDNLRKSVLGKFLKDSARVLGKLNKNDDETSNYSLDMNDLKQLLIEKIQIISKENDSYCNDADKMIKYIDTMPDVIVTDSADTVEKWVNAFYYYIYYVIISKIHYKVSLTSYSRWDADLNEYNKVVTEMYGNSSDPGYFYLYELANRKDNPNIIAMYELADKYYYGLTHSRVENYDKAFYYYNEVLKRHPSHPLALWSLAYIRLNYSSTLDPRYRIEMLENELAECDSNEWKLKIIEDVTAAYNLGCVPAINLIGKILEKNDIEMTHLLSYALKLKTNKEKDELFWFRKAAQHGYLLAHNNCAVHCIDRACNREFSRNIPEEKRYWAEALEHLEYTSSREEPWACNYLGYRILYYGVKSSIDGRATIVKPDKERAYKLFNTALQMRQNHYYYSLINLCNMFYLNKKSKYYMAIPYDRIYALVTNALDDSQISCDQREKLTSIMEIIELINKTKWTKTTIINRSK